jgi:hypothetical protein
MAEQVRERFFLKISRAVCIMASVHLTPASVHLTPAKEGGWSEELQFCCEAVSVLWKIVISVQCKIQCRKKIFKKCVLDERLGMQSVFEAGFSINTHSMIMH